MQFTVRYWSSLLPNTQRERRGTHRWLDYSVHPASKLGLHNAMLAMHDRSEILQAHGCQFECAVFVVGEGVGDVVGNAQAERLSPETANALFAALPSGELKWLAIREFLLPARPVETFAEIAPEAAAPTAKISESMPEQLPLFAHVHTPYDDLNDADETIHTIDLNT